MPPLLADVIRVLTGVLGLILVYLAAFTYESTDKRIANILQDLWLQLAYDARTPVTVAKRFLWVVLNLMDRAFERVFGRNGVSFRSFSVALCYAYAALPLTYVALYVYTILAKIDLDLMLKGFPRIAQPREQIALGLALVGIGTLPAVHASLRWLTSVVAFGTTASVGVTLWAVATHRPELAPLFGSDVWEIVVPTLVVVPYGIAVIYVIRWAVRLIVNRKLTRGHLLLIAGLLALPIFSFCLLLAIMLIIGHFSRSHLIVLVAHLFRWPGAILLLFQVGGPASTWGMAAFIGLAFSILVLLHLAIWPLIRWLLMKALYAAQRHELIRQKAKLASIGLSAMAFAIAPGPIIALWGRITTNIRHLFV